MTRYRIRRCGGNSNAWILVSLGADGQESHVSGTYWTGLSIDLCLRYAKESIGPDAVIELHWTTEGAGL